MPESGHMGLCDVCVEHLCKNDGLRCARCDIQITDTGVQCALCLDCETHPPAYRRLRAPWVYGGPLLPVLAAGKFRKQSALCRQWGELILDDTEVVEILSGADALVPIPLSPRRARERGYNQSGILAGVLGQTFNLPVMHFLRRIKNTQPQTQLDRKGRQNNLNGAFALTRAGRRSPKKHVVLVDDVVTSTSTVREAAGALSQGREIDVSVVALARAVLSDSSAELP